MSLLTLVQSVASKVGVNRPSTVISNNAIESLQIQDAVNEAGVEVLRAHDWQVMRREQTFTSVATETQTSMVPAALDRFISDSFWNRSQVRPFKGPVTPQEWQYLKATTVVPVNEVFTVRGGNILILPTPTAGDTFAYEYISNRWRTNSGGTEIAAFSADTDLVVLEERLIALCATWIYKKSRGLPWEGDYEQYAGQLYLAKVAEGPRTVINFIGYGPKRPGVAVPEGTWNL